MSFDGIVYLHQPIDQPCDLNRSNNFGWGIDEHWDQSTNQELIASPKVNHNADHVSTTIIDTYVDQIQQPKFDELPSLDPTKFPQSMQSVINKFCFSLEYPANSVASLVFSDYHCFWPQCSSTDLFKDFAGLRKHIEDIHVSNLQASWPGCKWPECGSKQTSFKTSKLLEEHLQNIHIEPLICQEPRCLRTEPFGKKGDLERHHKSKHSDGTMPFTCPRPNCPKPIHGFARRDKLREHIRNWHGSFECPEQDCHRGPGNGFRTNEQLQSHVLTPHRGRHSECPLPHCDTSNTVEAATTVLLGDHFRAVHGEYDCEIGQCELSRSSEFMPDTLRKHLIKDHGIVASEAAGLVDALIKAGDCVLKTQQLVRLGWIQGQRDQEEGPASKIFMECFACSQQN